MAIEETSEKVSSECVESSNSAAGREAPTVMAPAPIVATADAPNEGEIPNAPAHDGAGRLDVLRHKHFRTVWYASFFAYMGNWFEFIGMQWIVAKLTESTVWLTAIGIAQLTPMLVLGMLGGVVADRVNRKTLLLTTQSAMMIIAIAFSIVVALANAKNPLLGKHAFLWWLLALGFLQGVTSAFHAPAGQVLTPRLVPRSELIAAITLQGISFNVARAIGPAIGALIMGAFGASWLFALNAVGFIIVFFALLTTPDAPAPPREGSPWDFQDAKKDTLEAISLVWHHKGMRAALLATVVFSLLATPVLRFLPLFVSQVYHLEEGVYGIVTGLMGAGAAVGGLSLKFVPKWYPRHHLIPFSVFLGGLWIFIFAITTNVWLAGVFMFFVGFFWMWAFNSAMSALQVLVSDSMRGRVLSVCNTLAFGLMPLGAVLASAVGESSGAAIHKHLPDWWYEGLDAQIGIGFVAFVLMCAGVVMLIWRTPEVDGLKPGDDGYARSPGFWRGIFGHAHRPPHVS